MTEAGFDNERINKFFSGELPEDDGSYIGSVFLDEGNEQKLKDLLLKQFDELPAEDDSMHERMENMLYRIHYYINTNTKQENRRDTKQVIIWAARMASILILPVVLYFGISNYKEANVRKETWTEIQAPAWTRAKFNLPDGSTGWINSNSSIRYKGDFINNRRVTLKGEAFFEVHADKKRPFTVSANKVITKVLGTRFNIASYENESTVEIVLEEGKLVFSDEKNTYTMQPNDLVIYNKDSQNYSVTKVQPQKYLSWKEGKLVFRNDPIDVIARRLERWYNIEVDVHIEHPQDIRWRATFIDEGLEEVLGYLKRSLPVDYVIERGEINADGTYSKKKVKIYSAK